MTKLKKSGQRNPKRSAAARKRWLAENGKLIGIGALTLKDSAQYLGGLNAATIHRLVQRGLLRPNRATRRLLFSKEELDRFLRETAV
jgi:hypothetical protein